MNVEAKDRTLEVTTTDDQLVITIGLDALVNILSSQPEWPLMGEDQEPCKVLDHQQFIKDVVCELQREEEDGTTLLHRALDRAAIDAIENGSEAVDYDG